MDVHANFHGRWFNIKRNRRSKSSSAVGLDSLARECGRLGEAGLSEDEADVENDQSEFWRLVVV